MSTNVPVWETCCQLLTAFVTVSPVLACQCRAMELILQHTQLTRSSQGPMPTAAYPKQRRVAIAQSVGKSVLPSASPTLEAFPLWGDMMARGRVVPFGVIVNCHGP